MKRNEFPHSRHMQVEGGCYACHEFNSDNPEMDVMTPPKIKDCSACHTTHDNIAGGKCDDCHKKGDAVYAAKPLPWERRPDKGYSHFSPGHIGPTNAGKCTDCHGEEIWQAKTIDAITIPPENDPRCRDCHAKERFHTR